MKHFLLYFFLLVTITTYGQVGIGTSLPDASSVLDVSSTTQGMLTPRMTSAQISAISSPATGLLVFDTTLNAFYFYNSTSWVSLGVTSTGNDYSGWGVYNDTQFTEAAPGMVAGNTTYYMPNNAGNKIESQLPLDVATFYDTSTQSITGRNGDGLNVVIEFKLKPTTNLNTRVTLSIDIGGGVGEIYKRDFTLTKGVGEEHFYLSSFDAYTLGTWQANGGRVLIRSTAAVEVYEIRYVLTRTHKAR